MVRKLKQALSLALIIGFASGYQVYNMPNVVQAEELYKVGDSITLYSKSKRYMNAEDAIKEENSVGIYDEGTYFVYKIAENGAINVTKVKGEAGSWLNPNVIEDSHKDSITFFITNDVNAYRSEEDALNRTNPTSVYKKGLYYTYKLSDKAVNVTRNEGSPGGWINLGDLLTNPIPEDEYDIKTSMLYVLEKEVNSYSDSRDALHEENSSGKLSPGLYYITERLDGAASLKKNPNQKDIWISIDENTPLIDLDEYNYEIFYLKEDSLVFYTSLDAFGNTFPVRKYPMGYYFIYKQNNKAINISNYPNIPGGWINIK